MPSLIDPSSFRIHHRSRKSKLWSRMIHKQVRFPLGSPRNAWKRRNFWRAVVPPWEGNEVQKYKWLSQGRAGRQTRIRSHWEFHSHVWPRTVYKPGLCEWHTLHLVEDWKRRTSLRVCHSVINIILIGLVWGLLNSHVLWDINKQEKKFKLASSPDIIISLKDPFVTTMTKQCQM